MFIWLCIVLVLAFPHLEAQEPPPPRPVPAAEVVRILTDLIQIDTTNPPGNETVAAQYLLRLFEAEGIEAEVLESAPGRGNIVARLGAPQDAGCLLLLGHLDVVGVERGAWRTDPYRAHLEDGYLYGRGALDDKAMVAVNAVTMFELKRANVPLRRDVVFLATAGEEGTPQFGIDYMIQHHWDKIDCELALNEGGFILEEDERIAYAAVATAEKIPYSVRLRATGAAGHGSIPRPDNAIARLARAVSRLAEWTHPANLSETTELFFARLATLRPDDVGDEYRRVRDAGLQRYARFSRHQHDAMVRNTVTPTILKAGFRTNAVSGEAEAVFDVRLLPGQDAARFLEELHAHVGDSEVTIEMNPIGRPAAPPSPVAGELFVAIERAQQLMFPGAATLPLLLTGATDSAQLRHRGVHVYGVGTVQTEEDRQRVHGSNERVSLKGVSLFMEFLQRIIYEAAVAPTDAP